MNVAAPSGGAPLPDPRPIGAAVLPRLPSLHAGSVHDNVATSLPELALPAVQQLLQAVENRLFPGGAQHAESIHAPVHAPANGAYLPDNATLDARNAAAISVAKAGHAIEGGGGHGQRIPENLNPRAVLSVANQFIETGQLPNYLRAEELGRLIVSWYDGPLPIPIGSDAVSDRRDRERQRQLRGRSGDVLNTLWSRAPLLVLLAGWLVAGTVAALLFRIASVPAAETATALDIWALGFPVLVVFQFVATIRGVFRSKRGADDR